MLSLSKAYCIRAILAVTVILALGVGVALAYAPGKAIATKWEYKSLKRSFTPHQGGMA